MSADANNNTSVAPQGEPNGQQDAPDWDSYEIGEKEIRAVFDAVFYVYDKDSRGYLTTDQFGVRMMKHKASRLTTFQQTSTECHALRTRI